MTRGAVDDLCLIPATEQRALLAARRVSCIELVHAQIAAIERHNPAINAIVTMDLERAVEQARDVDAAGWDEGRIGPLHGLCVANKDVNDTRGLRTTLGSPVYADRVPDADALIVERMRGAGAIVVGKTNTPELAAGSQTYNRVFGATRNPYDPTRTCGGSSGGAAAALACGMIALADGSDMGGSLRNPASFCNVVGMRPSPGVVPVWPASSLWDPLGVHGPMGRTVADVALALGVIAGGDPRAPLAVDLPASEGLERDFAGTRVAWSRSLGGLPVEAAVTAALDAGRPGLDAIGLELEDIEPDFAGAQEAFTTWRAWLFELNWGPLYDQRADDLGEDVRWNIERGRSLTAADLASAERARTALFHRMRAFFDRRRFLLAPVVQTVPFDVELHYPTTVAGEPMESYIDWMRSCYYVSAAALPAASVPFGFTPEGLPVGLQVIGRNGDDWGVLQLARAIEDATQAWKRRPGTVDGG